MQIYASNARGPKQKQSKFKIQKIILKPNERFQILIVENGESCLGKNTKLISNL